MRSESAGENPDRKKEPRLTHSDPSFSIGRESATGHDAVDVWMKHESLPPGVEHTERPGQEVQLASCDIGQRGSDRSKQKVIKDTRCLQSEHVEFFWHSEYNVKVRNRKKLLGTRLEPCAPRRRLTSRTGSVPARMPLNVLVAAVVTLLPLPAKSGRPACADRAHRFPLNRGGPMSTAVALAARPHDRAEVGLGVHGFTPAVKQTALRLNRPAGSPS
jgi:hypothetical protein